MLSTSSHDRQFQTKDGMTLGGRRARGGFELIRQKWLFENAQHGVSPFDVTLGVTVEHLRTG